jgi:hypothetical protein
MELGLFLLDMRNYMRSYKEQTRHQMSLFSSSNTLGEEKRSVKRINIVSHKLKGIKLAVQLKH